MKRRVPRLRSDEEAEAFLESDLSELDFSQFKSGRLRLQEGAGISNEMRLEKTSSALPLGRKKAKAKPLRSK